MATWIEKELHLSNLGSVQNSIWRGTRIPIERRFPTCSQLILILDITHDSKIALKDLVIFKDLAKKHKSAKKSLVIVAQDIDFDETPSYLVVVPSVLEAHDIIEMDEIERDLGF